MSQIRNTQILTTAGPVVSRAVFHEMVAFAVEGSLFPNSYFHGQDHWRAVATQGLRLAEICGLGQTGRSAAALFGLFHDCRRENDGWDPEHGQRGAQAFLNCPLLTDLDKNFESSLVQSMNMHDAGETTDNPLIGLGWDADRSVLGRVGIDPSLEFFSCVPKAGFADFVRDGEQATEGPLTWAEIWARAFGGAP